MEEYYQRYRANSGKFKEQKGENGQKDKKAKTVVTVCTIMDGNKFGRGVSVCSPSDTPNMVAGSNWARRYAIHSIKPNRKGLRRPDVPITDYRAIRTILNTDCPFVMQSEMNPNLTFQEKAFFFGKKNVGAGKIHLVELTEGNGTTQYFSSDFRDPNPLI